MIQRCTNPKETGYRHYGGRGIHVCDVWLSDFEAFFEHVGPRPSKDLSLDRIDVDGNYEPGNVRWATRREQALNKRKALFCKRGHEFTPDNTIVLSYGRLCRTCVEDRNERIPAADKRYKITHCKRGHELSGENIRIDRQGRRICRACMKMHRAAFAAKRGPGAGYKAQKERPGFVEWHRDYQREYARKRRAEKKAAL